MMWRSVDNKLNLILVWTGFAFCTLKLSKSVLQSFAIIITTASYKFGLCIWSITVYSKYDHPRHGYNRALWPHTAKVFQVSKEQSTKLKNSWNCTWSVIPSIRYCADSEHFVKHPRSGLPPTVLYNLSYLQLQLQFLWRNTYVCTSLDFMKIKLSMCFFNRLISVNTEIKFLR